MLNSFVKANRRLSFALTPRHVLAGNVFAQYERLAPLLMSYPDVKTVVDVGAGKSWHFPDWMKEAYGLHLIGLDIDGDEMVPNCVLDERIACDVTRSIPVPPGSVDLVTAYSGVEHFSDNQAFLRNAFIALRPGGALIAQFPNSLAPFALLNRIMPEKLKGRLLQAAMPGSTGVLGFKVYYDKVRPSQFKRIAKLEGFVIEQYYPGYYSSGYFAAFTPVYIVSYIYDMIRYGLGISEISSYSLFVLRKPGPHKRVVFQA